MANSNPKRPATSASAGNSLPPEITEAILPLLPAKSLGRFKSVSKTWNSLISDPQFIKAHLHHHMDRYQSRKMIMVSYPRSLYTVGINELLSYLNSDEKPATAKELMFRLPLIRWKEISGSCNGLFLVEDVNDAIFLMNPTTREVWKVPDSPFAFPDEEFNLRYGFGYDSSSDDYKVVSLGFWYPESGPIDRAQTDLIVTVYSLRSNSWRRLPDYTCDYDVFAVAIGALINQSFHWLVNTSMIIAFSLADEKFSKINLSESFERASIGDLADIGGKLGVYLLIEKAYEWWVMEEFGVGNSWTRVVSHEIEYPISPMRLVDGSGRHIMLSHEGRVVVYNNIDESRCRTVRVGGPREFIIFGGTYVESLESPARIVTPP